MAAVSVKLTRLRVPYPADRLGRVFECYPDEPDVSTFPWGLPLVIRRGAFCPMSATLR